MDYKVYQLFKSRPNLYFAAGLILILTGLLLSDLPAMIASRSWPSVEGVITSRTKVVQQFEEYDGDLYQHVDIYLRYEYLVAGEKYSSTRLNAIDSYAYPEDAAGDYQEGDLVVVYYSPSDPARAVLDPGFIWSTKAFDVFAFLPFAAGLFLILQGIRRKQYLASKLI